MMILHYIAAFFLLSMLVFLLLLMLPRLAFNKKKAEVEAELPLFLRTLSMLLELKIPFHTALETLSRERFAISRELGSAVKEIRRGATVEAALASLAKEFDSLEIKRAVSQVLSAYESGGGAESIKKISDDMFFLQQHRMKEFSSKQAMFSLLFIAASTILPSVYLIFSVLGKVVFLRNRPFLFHFCISCGVPASLRCNTCLFFPAFPNTFPGRKEKRYIPVFSPACFGRPVCAVLPFGGKPPAQDTGAFPGPAWLIHLFLPALQKGKIQGSG